MMTIKRRPSSVCRGSRSRRTQNGHGKAKDPQDGHYAPRVEICQQSVEIPAQRFLAKQKAPDGLRTTIPSEQQHILARLTMTHHEQDEKA